MKMTAATSEDIDALHSLIESAYRGDSAKKGWTHEADLLGGQRTDKPALLEIIHDPKQVVLIAKVEGRLAGCVQLSRASTSKAYLGLLTVDPDLQAGGLGKRILTASEQYVSDSWESSAIEMTVIRQRTELISYYQRRGFELTGERRPFPMTDPRFGLPKTSELEFVVLQKAL